MTRDGSVETWSSRVEALAELPEACVAQITEIFSVFPYCVRCPATRGMRASEPETYLCQAGQRLLILKRRRASFERRLFDLEAVGVLETATTLLASRMTFYFPNGLKESLLYNTVSLHLFEPIIAAFKECRARKVPQELQVRSLRPDPFSDLVQIDFKYHSYAVEVMGDDELRSRFYHRETAAPRFLAPSRVISSYLLALSPSMLYGISEEPPFRSRHWAEYSHMTRYVPLAAGPRFAIQSVADEERYAMLVLEVGRTRFQYPLARASRPAFEKFEGATLACSTPS